jgi:hypothetical protein
VINEEEEDGYNLHLLDVIDHHDRGSQFWRAFSLSCPGSFIRKTRPWNKKNLLFVMSINHQRTVGDLCCVLHRDVIIWPVPCLPACLSASTIVSLCLSARQE